MQQDPTFAASLQKGCCTASDPLATLATLGALELLEVYALLGLDDFLSSWPLRNLTPPSLCISMLNFLAIHLQEAGLDKKRNKQGLFWGNFLEHVRMEIGKEQKQRGIDLECLLRLAAILHFSHHYHHHCHHHHDYHHLLDLKDSQQDMRVVEPLERHLLIV